MRGFKITQIKDYDMGWTDRKLGRLDRFFWVPKWKTSLVRPRHVWKVDVKMDLREMYELVDEMKLAEDKSNGRLL
jgi:hypothetical protein